MEIFCMQPPIPLNNPINASLAEVELSTLSREHPHQTEPPTSNHDAANHLLPRTLHNRNSSAQADDEDGQRRIL